MGLVNMIVLKIPWKGRCVYAAKSYKTWETVEVCEYITIPREQVEILKKTVLNDYRYWIDWKDWDAALMLWFWSLYNHSSKNPNMKAIYDSETKRMWFMAICDIKIYDELTHNYWYPVPWEKPSTYIDMKAVRKLNKKSKKI